MLHPKLRRRYDVSSMAAPVFGREGEVTMAITLNIAGGILFLLSDLAAAITGHTLIVDGGAQARFPLRTPERA